MKVSAEWVNSFLTKPFKTQALADAMELAAIEVEGIELARAFDDRIVVGEVTHLEPHPNASKLKIAQVNVNKSTLDIVCGAPNIQHGQKVVVAQVGSVLPDGTKIEKAVLRGVHSNGMLCSEAELGLSSDHAGILVLPSNIKNGSKINNVLKQHDVIDVKSAANRWDLNSMIGIAREVAAQTGQKLKREYPEQLKGSTAKGATIQSKTLATRYSLLRLKVKPGGASPTWLQQHLQAAGIRSISPIVDATNFIMLEYGQPLHAFDAHKVSGKLQVRLAKKGENLTTLDGVQRKLDPADIVIADDHQVVGFAGVMGGENSEIDDSTTEILVEAASFNPTALRKTAIRHGLRTDASARFERGIPSELPLRALQAVAKLLGELVEAESIGDPIDIIADTPTTTNVAIKPARINSILGLSLAPKQVIAELAKLQFVASDSRSVETASVTIPWWRPDVTLEEDLAEEVIKLVGYDELPPTLPQWRPQRIEFDQHWSQLWQAKAVLRSFGLFEVATYSFISEHDIKRLGWKTKDFLKLKNPLSSEQAYLRESLLPSHLNTVAKNRKYAKSFGLFEFSKTYVKRGEGKLPLELASLGVMVVGKDAYQRVKAVIDRLAAELGVDFEVKPKVYDKHIAHPTRSGELHAGGDWVGLIGELHPALVSEYKISGEVGYLEISWELLTKHAHTKRFIEPSRFPAINRDISVKVNRTVTWAEVKEVLKDYEVQFISDYYGNDLPPDKKSLTIRVTLTNYERTPTDKEANELAGRCQGILINRYGANLRA